MTPHLGSSLIGLTNAERARSALAASSSLAWVAGTEAGSALFYEECGFPILLTTDGAAEDLMRAGAGRITLDQHPHVGLVRLVGEFWPLANADALPRLEAIKRDHRDCTNCISHQLSRMIGLHVVTAAIRLPGEREFRPISLDDYTAATPDPVVACGAVIAAHLNTAHQAEIRSVGANLLEAPAAQIAGASIGAVSSFGFELSISTDQGGRVLALPFDIPPVDEADLQRSFRRALIGTDGSTDSLCI